MLYSVLCLFHKEVILNNARTPSFATTYRQTRVYSVNCRNERGRRLRKDRILPAGVRLPVISSGTSTGVLMHGAPYYIVLDGDGNQLTLMGNQVYLSERFDTPAPEWVDKLNQLLHLPGAVDPEEVNALVRSMEASGIKELPGFLYSELPDRGISKCDYCGWWRNRDGRGHQAGCYAPETRAA